MEGGIFVHLKIGGCLHLCVHELDKLDLIRAVSIDTRAMKQLLTPNSVPGFLSHCPLPDYYGPITYQL